MKEHFYLLFPLGVSLLFARFDYERIAAIFAIDLCDRAAVAVLARRGIGVSDLYTYEATDARLDSILVGCVLGVWCNPTLDKPFATDASFWRLR